MKKIAMLLALAGILALSGCGYSVPSNMVAVHVSSGPWEATKVVGCENPATRGWWTNDKYFLFPTSQREWDATGQHGSDSGPFTSVTKDSVVMDIPITIRFSLKTDCPTLKSFYTRYAQRYGAQFNSDGTYNQQWETLLRKLVRDPSETALDRIIQDYDWHQVWNDPSTKTLIEQRMDQNIQTYLHQTAQGTYFEDATVILGSAHPQNKALMQAVASAQTNVAQAQSQQAQADADVAKANAQVKVAQAEAKKQRAEIEGYGGIEGYLKFKCIENGCNPYQPTYIVSGTKPQ